MYGFEKEMYDYFLSVEVASWPHKAEEAQARAMEADQGSNHRHRGKRHLQAAKRFEACKLWYAAAVHYDSAAENFAASDFHRLSWRCSFRSVKLLYENVERNTQEMAFRKEKSGERLVMSVRKELAVPEMREPENTYLHPNDPYVPQRTAPISSQAWKIYNDHPKNALGDVTLDNVINGNKIESPS
ncbi:hypothetical protein KW805_03840 [Candidatus Pacearchaeota archaeon]|nr:hypothetical protein [Candidatus Pacearchaeota archaeon]